MLLPIVAAVAVLVLYVIVTYNKFATLKTQIEASIQEIGNQLKRQADLIPNLQASAKGFLKQEKGIFDALTSARKSIETAIKSGSAESVDEAQTAIGKMLPQLRILVESNPEIKSADIIRQLMDELRDTSDKVMYSRRTLIDVTQEYNQMLATFPSNFIGQTFGMKKQAGLATPTSGEFLTVSESDTKTPKVEL